MDLAIDAERLGLLDGLQLAKTKGLSNLLV